MSRLSAALTSAIQHAMPPEFGRKWGTECLNTRFPLPTLLCAGYSVKLILIYFFNIFRLKLFSIQFLYKPLFSLIYRITASGEEGEKPSDDVVARIPPHCHITIKCTREVRFFFVSRICVSGQREPSTLSSWS